MTSTTPNTAPAPPALPAYPRPQKVTQARVLRSEWTKLRTQPSALWSLLSAVILVVAFGIGYSLLREARPPHGAAAIASSTRRRSACPGSSSRRSRSACSACC